MSKLQENEELTPTEEGIDPVRVEEAFATFADRVRELESVASELRAELRSLRAERAVPNRFEDENWPVESRLAGSGLPPDWVATVPPPPFVRGLTVPRLAIEGAFLLLVAVLAGLADLSAGWIVLVMAVAWALVAMAEWAAAAKRSRWRLDEIAPAVPVAGSVAADTGPWDMPVVEATAIESEAPASASTSESNTIVTKLPVEPDEDADQHEPEAPAAPRRRFRLWRTRSEPAAADPWET